MSSGNVDLSQNVLVYISNMKLLKTDDDMFEKRDSKYEA